MNRLIVKKANHQEILFSITLILLVSRSIIFLLIKCKYSKVQAIYNWLTFTTILKVIFWLHSPVSCIRSIFSTKLGYLKNK